MLRFWTATSLGTLAATLALCCAKDEKHPSSSEGDGTGQGGLGGSAQSGGGSERSGDGGEHGAHASSGGAGNKGPVKANPGTPCGAALSAATECYEEVFTDGLATMFATVAASCEASWDDPDVDREELVECVACLDAAFNDCPRGYYQMRARVIADCKSCDDSLIDFKNGLPLYARPVYCDEPEFEVCDGQDNDCDGEVDEGQACPDESVTNTQPFEGFVYLSGNARERTEDGWMFTVWPELETELYELPSYPNKGYRLNGRTYHWNLGILSEMIDGEEVPVPTSPCEEIRSGFGFDETGSMVYDCLGARGIYRDGVFLNDVALNLIGVLGDGRLVGTIESDTVMQTMPLYRADDVVLLTPEGEILSRAAPHEEFGDLEPWGVDLDSCRVRGNQATVVFQRSLPRPDDQTPAPLEALIYNLNSNGTWERVRWLRLEPQSSQRFLWGLPDGTLFSSGASDKIHVYLPDGSNRTLYDAGSNDALVENHLALSFGD